MLARHLTRDGRAIWCEWYSSAFRDEGGKLSSILSLAQDVTARVEAEEQLKQAAVNDALTGLPNRNALAARLGHALMRVNRAGDRLALLFIDLDRFKKVNDTLGHAAARRVLRQAAGRIRAASAKSTRSARLGGTSSCAARGPTCGRQAGHHRRAHPHGVRPPFDYRGAEVRAAQA